MLKEESIWIREILKKTDLSSVREVLDVGSSTMQFRTQVQPYIDENVFKPLRDKNIAITYMDKKDGEGVDLVFNVENSNADEVGRQFSMIICCSLLEHVRNPEKVASFLMDLLESGGRLLVTVPRSYRYHPDPIDTMYRPSIDELIPMFPGMQVLNKAVIHIKDREKYSKKEIYRYLLPFLNWKVNCLFMRKR